MPTAHPEVLENSANAIDLDHFDKSLVPVYLTLANLLYQL